MLQEKGFSWKEVGRMDDKKKCKSKSEKIWHGSCMTLEFNLKDSHTLYGKLVKPVVVCLEQLCLTTNPWTSYIR